MLFDTGFCYNSGWGYLLWDIVWQSIKSGKVYKMSERLQRLSWSIKDQHIAPELIALMHLTPSEAAMLSELHQQAQALAPQMTAAFYDRLLARPETSEYFADKQMDQMHATIGQWFSELFAGTYDEAYARKRLQIGVVHVKIGLPVRYPLAMMDVLLEYGQRVARQHPQPDQALVAFHKVLALDIAIFNQAYEDNQLKHLAELVGGERLARNVLAGIAS